MSTPLWVYGPFANDDGATMWPAGVGERSARIECCRADDGYRDTQPSHIPVHVRHSGPEIGQVHHLEYRHRQLFAVAEIDVDLIDPATLPPDATTARWFWSAGTEQSSLCDRYHVTDVVITEMSMVTRPAVVCLRELQSTRSRPDPKSLNQMMRRAAATIAERRYRLDPPPLRIVRLDDRGQPIRQHPSVHRRAGHRDVDGLVYQTSAHLGRVLSVS